MLFLVAFVALSAFFGFRSVPAERIAERIVALVPHVLLFVLVCLAALLATVPSQVKAAWQVSIKVGAAQAAAVGVVSGLTLAFVYLTELSPLLVAAQRTFGDFVPPGDVISTLSGSRSVFFLANVVLAPFVEETLYRGVALPVLTSKLGTRRALAISCGCFGLLHWAGGLWYMLLTGVVAGGLFAGLYLWRKGIVAPFCAHLALNLAEFLFAWRTTSNA